MSSPEEYKNNLLNIDLQSFLNSYKEYDALKLKSIFPDTYKLLAAQLSLYPKAIKKLPVFTSKYCYLTSKSYEQSSSEMLAGYKASLLTPGEIIIDLTAGLGIDDIAFSKVFKKVIAVETDHELNMLGEINNIKLGIENIIKINSKAEEYIKEELKADLIYIDADRRSADNPKRAVTLHDSSPDILSIMNRLFEITPVILLKLSPLIDITYLTKTLSCIQWIRVVSLAGEVKEILVMLNRDTGNSNADERNSSDTDTVERYKIIAADLSNNGMITEFCPGGRIRNKSTNRKYFIAAGSSLVKAGLVKDYANEYGFNLLNISSPYMTAENLPENIFGKAYSIIYSDKFSKSGFNNYIKANAITKANVSCKNFPVKVQEIRKSFGLKDGGEDHFFFTSTDDKTKIFYHCKPVKSE